MPTIIDVAKAAGVSKSTVSRVLSGNGYVSDSSQKKVLAAVKETGYTPNMLARHLQSGQTKTIAFIAHDYTERTGPFLNAFVKIARKYDYFVNLYLTGGDQTKEKEALDLLMYKQVDGAFLFTRTNHWDVITNYHTYGPLATWHRIDSPYIFSSYIDQYDGYHLSLDFLYRQGYRHIGHVFGSERNLNTTARITALTDFYQEHQLHLDKKWLFFDQYQKGMGRSIAHHWHEAEHRVEAMTFYTDLLAAEFISELQLLGYHIPQDIGVIGFDNNLVSELIHLTTVDYRLEYQAENCFAYLYNQLNKEVLPQKKIKQQLIVRSSTKQLL